MKKIPEIKLLTVWQLEKLMDMKISDIEKQELKEKLLNSYDKLGKTKEYFALKKSGEKV